MTDHYLADRDNCTGRTVVVTGVDDVISRAVLSRLGVSGINSDAAQGGVDENHRRSTRSESEPVDVIVYSDSAGTLLPDEGAATRRTHRVVTMAQQTGATLFHIGSAFVGDQFDGSTQSSRAGTHSLTETLIAQSGIPHVNVRSSIVIEDSRTGAVAELPGIYLMIEAILRGQLSILPFHPDWRLDLIPCDTVADVVVRLIQHDVRSGTFHVTNGEQALTVEQFAEILVAFGESIGLEMRRLEFTAPDVRDVPFGSARPAGHSTRPRQRTIAMLAELFARSLVRGEPLESSLGDRFQTSISELGALGVSPLPDPRDTVLISLLRWARTHDFFGHQPAVA